MVRTWHILPQVPSIKLPSSFLPSVGEHLYTSLCRCSGTSTMQMLMTCILTSSTGSGYPGHSSLPGSEMPPNFSQGNLYRSGGCTGKHLRGSRALPLRLSPAHASCPGSARVPKWACRMSKASFPVQERVGLKPSIGCLLPCAPYSGMPFARLLLWMVRNSFSFLRLSKEENCVPGDDSHFTGLWTLTA